MTRESCINHLPSQPIAIVRQDYYLLMGKDCVSAALLNIFEYWANAAIAFNPNDRSPWLGSRPIKEFEELLLGISTDKQIRSRLKLLEHRGFIETRAACSYRKTQEFRFHIDNVQAAIAEIINGQTTVGSKKANGQTTVENPQPNGQTTVEPTVKQPLHLYLEGFKESLLEEDAREEIEKTPEPSEPAIDTSTTRTVNQSDLTPHQETGSETKYSAAQISQPTKIVNASEMSDLSFQIPVWGVEPSEKFLEYIVSHHLVATSMYRDSEVKPTVHRARSWLKVAKYQIDRRDFATDLYHEFVDYEREAENKRLLVEESSQRITEPAYTYAEQPIDFEAARRGAELARQKAGLPPKMRGAS